MAKKKKQKDPEPIGAKAIVRVRKYMKKFTPRQRIFADYVIQNREKLGFLSITEAAKAAGISQATIFRFCTVLGYEGYIEFSREIQQNIQAEMTSTRRFQLSRSHCDASENNESTPFFEKVLNQELENILTLSQNIKKTDYYQCIDLINQADRITIIGCMASSSLAAHFSQMLSKVFPNVDAVDHHSIITASKINRLTSDSVAFVIAFPRFPKETVELAKIAAHRGAHVICMTNSHLSPVMPFAEISFIMPISIPDFVDAYTAPVAFITALSAELGRKNPEKTQKGVEKFDDYVSKMDLFLKSQLLK